MCAQLLRLIGSRDGRDGAVTIHQDVDLYATLLAPGDEVPHDIAEGRGGWVHVARGSVTLNGETLKEGDGVPISASGRVRIKGSAHAEVLLFDRSHEFFAHEIST